MKNISEENSNEEKLEKYMKQKLKPLEEKIISLE